jgi:hypothetical protein
MSSDTSVSKVAVSGLNGFVSVSRRRREFLSYNHVHTGFRIPQAFYVIGSGGYFSGGKVAGLCC